MTTNEMELMARQLAANHGRTIEQARAALREGMYRIARELGMREVKIQAFRSTVGC